MRPAFLVDGVTEQKFIQLVCKGRPVKIINCNGSSVSASAIAKRAASLIRLWGGKFFPIILIVDREGRREAAAAFCTALRESIVAEGVNDQVIIGVADRMIENWMIADPAVWPAHEIEDNVDGFGGVGKVKKMMPDYDKAARGAGLLAKSRCSEICRRSESFSALFAQLTALRCAWLRR